MRLKEILKYVIYTLPLWLILVTEGFIQFYSLDLNRNLIYALLLVIFPFIYLGQTMLISRLGGSLKGILMMNCLVCILPICLFLPYLSWAGWGLLIVLIGLRIVIYKYQRDR